MASLGFDLLDRHVIAGRADDPASAAEPTMTFARLLEHSSAVAGALRILGLTPDTGLALDLPPGVDRLVVVCACLRLGIVPGDDAPLVVREIDGTTHVDVLEGPQGDPIDLATVRRAGGSDAAGALAQDPDGFREAARAAFPEVVEPLLAGRPVA